MKKKKEMQIIQCNFQQSLIKFHQIFSVSLAIQLKQCSKMLKQNAKTRCPFPFYVEGSFFLLYSVSSEPPLISRTTRGLAEGGRLWMFTASKIQIGGKNITKPTTKDTTLELSLGRIRSQPRTLTPASVCVCVCDIQTLLLFTACNLYERDPGGKKNSGPGTT